MSKEDEIVLFLLF